MWYEGNYSKGYKIGGQSPDLAGLTKQGSDVNKTDLKIILR